MDDDGGVLVPDIGQDGGQVEGPGVEGGAQDHGAADLPGDRRDVVPGGFHGIEDALGTGLQGRSVLGDGYRRDRAVEQRHPEFVLEAGHGAGHGRLDDVHRARGRGEAPGLAAGEEVLQVADLHRSTVWLRRRVINNIDGKDQN
jgi:hypothetical protein